MRKTFRQVPAICVCVLLAVAACAGLQPQVTVGPETGEKVIAMKASNFKFVPNNIKAYRGDLIMLEVENVSDSEHNLTIKDPHGQVLQNADIPPKKTVAFRITLPEAGEYDFYCDEPFHATFGMKGRIEVIERQ